VSARSRAQSPDAHRAEGVVGVARPDLADHASLTHQILPSATVANRCSQRAGIGLTCMFSASQQQPTLQDQIAGIPLPHAGEQSPSRRGRWERSLPSAGAGGWRSVRLRLIGTLRAVLAAVSALAAPSTDAGRSPTRTAQTRTRPPSSRGCRHTAARPFASLATRRFCARPRHLDLDLARRIEGAFLKQSDRNHTADATRRTSVRSDATQAGDVS
jgi:hypothetical protein